MQVLENTKWVSFRYEKCPDFCYKYGVIGHSERNCKVNVTINRRQNQNQFGPRMRAQGNRSVSQKEISHTIWTPNRQHWGFKKGGWSKKM